LAMFGTIYFYNFIDFPSGFLYEEKPTQKQNGITTINPMSKYMYKGLC